VVTPHNGVEEEDSGMVVAEEDSNREEEEDTITTDRIGTEREGVTISNSNNIVVGIRTTGVAEVTRTTGIREISREEVEGMAAIRTTAEEGIEEEGEVTSLPAINSESCRNKKPFELNQDEQEMSSSLTKIIRFLFIFLVFIQ
jgi:hypothetical protein